MERRIVDLELKFMEQGRNLEELSGVLFAQQKLIASMSTRIDRIEGRLRELGEPVPNEPPPHY